MKPREKPTIEETKYIPEDEFLREMLHQWIMFDNCPSNAFEKTWNEMVHCFNNQIRGIPGLHVIDSVCGSGKTLSMSVAAALLTRNWCNIGTLIVVRLKSQAVEVAQQINDISERIGGGKVATPFFSGTYEGVNGNLSETQQKETQVLVITHSRYLSGISGKGKNHFSKWQSGSRRFRVVDESLDLVERFHVTREQLVNAKTTMELRKDYYTSFYDKNEPYINLFQDIDRHIGRNIRSQKVHSAPFIDIIENNKVDGKEIHFAKVAELIEASSEKEYEGKKWKEGEFETFITEGVSTLHTLDRMMRRALYYSNDGKNQQYSTGEIILPNEFQSLCVLDATSNVDEVYKLFREKEQITSYEIPRDVRNFRNCTIHIRPENAGLGLGCTRKQVNPRAEKIVSWALEHFSPDDKVLFAGHKVLMEQVNKRIQAEKPEWTYDCCWWNAIDGKNKWRDYNKLVVLSLQYLPQSYGPVTAIGFSDINPDVQFDHPNIRESSHAVKLIQLFSRIRTRLVINEKGDCPESDIFLLLPSKEDIHPDYEDEQCFETVVDSLGQYLLVEMKSSMNGVKTDKWTSFSGFSNRKKESKSSVQDKFINWIRNMKPGETRIKKDFDIELTPKELNTLKCLLSQKDSRVTKIMRSFNITKVSTRGRYGTTTFTRLPN